MSDLSAGELERLALVVEEAGEIQQIVGKILRYGYSAYDPHKSGIETNKALLEKEIGDLIYAVNLLSLNRDVEPRFIEITDGARQLRKERYLYRQGDELASRMPRTKLAYTGPEPVP